MYSEFTVREGLEDASGAKVDTTNKISSATDLLKEIFTKSNIVIFFWFLAIYLVLSFLVMLFNPNIQSSMTSRAIDFIVLGGLLFFVVMAYYTKSTDEKKELLEDFYETIKEYLNNPITIISLGLFLVVFYLMIYLISIPMSRESKPISIMLIENSAWIFFIVSLIVTFFDQVFGIKITDYIDELFGKIEKTVSATSAAKTDASGVKVDASGVKLQDSAGNEVFNIKSNRFTYKDAQSVCKVYGARLATYDEVESAYNKGAEWCNYGWSEDQAAYFPTQKKTWEELQKKKGHENACGRPGVNGGFISNPNLRFGVNCYGKRPKASQRELDYMKANESAVSVKTKDDEIIDKKVKFWKDNKDRLLHLNSFNRTKWSEY